MYIYADFVIEPQGGYRCLYMYMYVCQEVFPITVSSKPGGGRRRTWEASVKVRRYRCIAIDAKA